MTEEQHAGEGDWTPADAGPAALGEVLHLYEELAARRREVRGDAERALDRVASLRAAGDPRAGIAVSACRDALGAYQEAVDRSLRQACDAVAHPAAASPTASPEPGSAPDQARSGPEPSAITAIRRKAARLLAAAAVTAVLGLVGWGGLPSWSTVTATSPGQLPDVGSDSSDTAGALERSASLGSPPDSSRRAAHAGPADGEDRAAASPDGPRRDVRRLLASTLPDVTEAPRSAARVAGALRSIGEAAASAARAGEILSPGGAESREDTDEAGSVLQDAVDAVGEAGDAAGDHLPGDDELDGEGLPDPTTGDEVDADNLDDATGDGPRDGPGMLEDDAASRDGGATGDAGAGADSEADAAEEDRGVLDGGDRSDGGLSDDAEFGR